VLIKLLRLKPEFLPPWLFWLLLLLGGTLALCVAAAGLWVLFTQVEFL